MVYSCLEWTTCTHTYTYMHTSTHRHKHTQTIIYVFIIEECFITALCCALGKHAHTQAKIHTHMHIHIQMHTYTKQTNTYIHINARKEGKNVLFNNTLNTFYIRSYGVRHMVNDHSEETCCHHMGYSLQLAARFFYMHLPTDRITHTMVFVTPVEIAQWIHHEGSIWWTIEPWVNALTSELPLALTHRCIHYLFICSV